MVKTDPDNKYYQNKKGKRWVIYKGEINASKIDSDWFSWIHYQTDKIPSENPEKKHQWQKPHKETKPELLRLINLIHLLNKAKNLKNMRVGNHNIFILYSYCLFFSNNLVCSRKVIFRKLEPTFEEETESTTTD